MTEPNLFFTRFLDIKDYTDVVSLTEQIVPKDTGFDPSKIPAFASKIGSIYQTGQSFRNIFNTNISPTDIAQLAKNGLSGELSKLIQKNGLSSFFSGRDFFDKTNYSFADSEKKLQAHNLSLNYNPLNIFTNFIERMVKNQSDDDSKAVEDFYVGLNVARKTIFDQNTQLYDAITSIIDVHTLHDLRRYTTQIEKVFTTSEIYDDVFTIYQQINQVEQVIRDFIAGHTAYLQFIRDKERYLAYIAKLDETSVTLTSLVTVTELKYAYEDLKTLRRVDIDTVFTEV